MNTTKSGSWDLPATSPTVARYTTLYGPNTELLVDLEFDTVSWHLFSPFYLRLSTPPLPCGNFHCMWHIIHFLLMITFARYCTRVDSYHFKSDVKRTLSLVDGELDSVKCLQKKMDTIRAFAVNCSHWGTPSSLSSARRLWCDHWYLVRLTCRY